MSRLQYLLSFPLFRMICISFIVFLSIIIKFKGINLLIINPIKQDISNAKRGVSKHENELLKLQREIDVLQRKIKKKTEGIDDKRYHHYYTFYSNPLMYLNKFLIQKSKPNGIIINQSSISPGAMLSGVEKRKLKPHIQKYGISKMKNINKVFTGVDVRISAEGQFFDMLQFINNLYDFPIDFSARSMTLTQNNNSISMEINLIFIAYSFDQSL